VIGWAVTVKQIL